MKSILIEVGEERARQDAKWGIQDHIPLKWNAILGEEFGEVSKAILENDQTNYREELIQVAAVAIAAIENLDRQLTLKNKDSGKAPVCEHEWDSLPEEANAKFCFKCAEWKDL
jgi:NTP pyrophosphatase (non-canonical NTP hydrolase)